MSAPMKDKETKKKREELKKKLYQMVDKFVEICALDSEYYLVEKNDYTSKIMEQQVRDMARSIEQDRIEQGAERRGLKKALEITREAVKVGQSLRKNALVYGHHEEVGLLICGVENELLKLLEEENGKQNAR